MSAEELFRKILPTAVGKLPSKRTVAIVALIATAITGLFFGSTIQQELQSSSWEVKEGQVLSIQWFTEKGWDAGGLTDHWQTRDYKDGAVASRVWYRYTVGETTTTNVIEFRYEEMPISLIRLDHSALQSTRVHYDKANPGRSTLVAGLRFRTVWRATWTFAASFAVLCLIVQTSSYFLNASKEVDELDELRRQQSWRDL